MPSTVQCFGDLPTSRGQTAPFQFEITVSLETATVADLRNLVVLEIEKRNVSLLGMYVGDTQIDSAEREPSTLLKEIAGFSPDKNIRCKVEPKASDGNSNGIIAGCGTALGALSGPAVVQASVAAAGFGAEGIVAGTPAAALMASYGGSVGAGSVCSVLQSVGAAGLGIGVGIPLAVGVGGLLGYGLTRSLIAQNSPGSMNNDGNTQHAHSGAENGDPSGKPSPPGAENGDPSGKPAPPGAENGDPSGKPSPPGPANQE
ncbi:hypothetical protein PtB15_17B45 [Puccinia triticina]|nr:hypothetical protein PtB15_17B45 [Puccinia triticina]